MPIKVELTRPMEVPQSPFGQCGNCQYVGTDIHVGTKCPACGASQANGCGVWPSPEFEELWDDVVFAWNHERAEIATVVAAMYFEASVFDLIKWGTHWLDPELNWRGAAFDDVREKSERIWKYLLTIRSRKATDNAFKRLFGVGGREMLETVLGDDAKDFWNNYRRLAEFRNQIVHSGRRVWYRGVDDPRQDRLYANRLLSASIYFVPTCWGVFSMLWNEYIHERMLERKKDASG